MPGPVTNLRSLDSANFKTSKRADGVNELMKSKLGLQYRYEPARLAIAHSLALLDPAPPLSDDDADDSGKVIMGKNLFGEDELPVWVAMLVEKTGLPYPTVEDVQEQVRRHWHRGVLLLKTEWENCGETYERFMLFLAQRAGLPAHGPNATMARGDDGPASGGSGLAIPIMVRLGDPGTDEKTGLPANWLLNGKGSPHVALMGGTGSGKTRLARSILGQIRVQSKVPCIIFDFKGDLASNPAFVSEVGATIVASPANPVPLDVLHIPDSSPTEVTNGAIRFRDSFVLIPKSRPGAVQADELRDAARAAFQKRRPDKPIEISTVRDELLALYAATSRKGNTLTATFNEMTQWKLFDPRMAPADFFGRSWIIDVHNAPETAQRLVVFLVLDALYAYFKSLPDSTMDSQGHRALRLVLVVDEARRVLNYGQPSLISLVRESRSKGMSVFLISQSPEDFDTGEDNFLEQIGLTVCFRSNGTSPGVLKACLGQPVDLAGLPDGVAVTRLPGLPGVTRIKAWE
jgi:DNA sulfur modification protein DndE